MTTEQSIAVDYFIELMEKHRVRALVIQKGSTFMGSLKPSTKPWKYPSTPTA